MIAGRPDIPHLTGSVHAAYLDGATTPSDRLSRAEALAAQPSAAHVFIRQTPELAGEQARASDARFAARTPIGPLDGAIVAWKDVFDQTGQVTTAGSRTRDDAAPAAGNATAVTLLEQAGACSLGRTNLSEFAFSGLGLNPGFGTPVNPVSNGRDLVPGGSSSGSAVAVALGIADIGIGTDTSGSVRVPAALNGLIGFRPSLSRYDKHGVFPLAQSLDTIGTIARDLETIILTDRVLSRSTDSVPAGTITEVIDITDSMDILWDDEVRRNHDALREALQQAGLKVRSNQLQSVRRAKELMQEFGTLVAVEARRLHDPLMTSDAAALTDPFILRRLSQAPVLSDADYATYLTRRAEARRMAQFEIGQALVIHPTTPLAAPSIAEATASPEAFAEINARMLSATMIGSFLDLPGLTLPSGATGDGRPTSTLLSAAPDADAELLAQAETLTNRIAGSELIQITKPERTNHG